MKPRLKKLRDQVIVITGASSGIGLSTARRAAQAGARLVLVARNEEALARICDELRSAGCEAEYVVADVADREQLERAGRVAMERFGGLDTWVNNAGVAIYGRNEDVPVEDQRRLFDTNFWGVVNGSVVAVRHLRERGGALINLGSELSDVAIPLQGVYAASKHAVRAYTDSLRMELEHEGAPISVTLIKPAGIDTMYLQHSKNYMDVEPKLPPPLYAPDVVAQAILHAAQHPKRDVFVGSASKLLSASNRIAPRLTDRLVEGLMFRMQRSKEPASDRERNSLHAPQQDLQERGGHGGRVRETSYYMRASTHPKTTGLLLVAAGLAVAALVQWRRGAPPFRRGLAGRLGWH